MAYPIQETQQACTENAYDYMEAQQKQAAAQCDQQNFGSGALSGIPQNIQTRPLEVIRMQLLDHRQHITNLINSIEQIQGGL